MALRHVRDTVTAITEGLEARCSARNRSRRQKRKEAEISFTFAARIPPGDYHAISRSSSVYCDKQFKRWVCAVQFDVLHDSLMGVLGRLTWYLNLGTKKRPHAGRRGNFWPAWARANGGPPKRNDRMSSRVFEGRHALVRVGDTAKTHNAGTVSPGESYSVIREVIEWRTGGPSQ